MLNIATVTAWQDGRAKLALPRDACAGCGRRCGIGQLAATRAPAELTLAVADELPVGDRVELQLDEHDLLQAALIGYLLPATLLILGAVAGHSLVDASLADAAAAIGALTGLTFGLRLARHLSRHLHQPRLIFPIRPGEMR